MDKTLTELSNLIENLRYFQSNSGSSEEFDKYEQMISELNKLYDQLVLLGG